MSDYDALHEQKHPMKWPIEQAVSHELAIHTNDGWVVTLISDKKIDISETILTSIIVQPREDWIKRRTDAIITNYRLEPSTR